MDLRALNKICFTICIICIVVGVVLGLALIWLPDAGAFGWKGLATVGLVFLGAALTLSVSKTFHGRLPSPPDDDDGR